MLDQVQFYTPLDFCYLNVSLFFHSWTSWGTCRWSTWNHQVSRPSSIFRRRLRSLSFQGIIHLQVYKKSNILWSDNSSGDASDSYTPQRYWTLCYVFLELYNVIHKPDNVILNLCNEIHKPDNVIQNLCNVIQILYNVLKNYRCIRV